MRKVIFANNEYYHIYNRGVDKKQAFFAKRSLFSIGFWWFSYSFVLEEKV